MHIIRLQRITTPLSSDLAMAIFLFVDFHFLSTRSYRYRTIPIVWYKSPLIKLITVSSMNEIKHSFILVPSEQPFLAVDVSPRYKVIHILIDP